MKKMPRRVLLRSAGYGAIAWATLHWIKDQNDVQAQAPTPPTPMPGMENNMDMHMPTSNGEVDLKKNGFDPADILTNFDSGKVSQLPNGQTLHEYNFTAIEKDLELVPGITFPAWTYNGRVPGPTIRVTEGDRVRVNFTNGSTHSHSIHFHGIHSGKMDGVFQTVTPGSSFTYEFDALPFGTHLYHCHSFPLATHMDKGLYGAFIIDPKKGRPPVDREMVMVLNGYDINNDGENDFYTVNGIPFYHMNHPIQIKTGEKIRIYVINVLGLDPINSFHLHANFFDYFPTGTRPESSEYTDTVMFSQAQRGILEFNYDLPGTYMFHAHQAEISDKGWMGVFEVK